MTSQAPSHIARRNRLFAIFVTLSEYTRFSLGLAVDALVLKLTGSNTRVGIIEGCSGIGSIVVGSMSGVLADRIGRAALLRASAVASIARAAALLSVVLVLEPRCTPDVISYVLVGAAFLEGLLTGFQISPLEALYADSTPAGDRARWFTLKGAASNIGMATGPAVAVGIFLATSDTWTPPELSAVILAAAGVGLLEAALLVCLRDVPGGGQHIGDHQTGGGASTDSTGTGPSAGDGDDGDEGPRPGEDGRRRSSTCDVSVWIAALVAIQDLLTGLGSGMCYKFQPLFLWQEFALSPVATNAIVASFQIAAALCQILITRLAQCIGGPAAAIIFRAGGVAGLAVVIFSTNRALVFAALIIRGALMNAIDGASEPCLLRMPCCSPGLLPLSLRMPIDLASSLPRVSRARRAHQVDPQRARARGSAREVESLRPPERHRLERNGIPWRRARRQDRLPPHVLHHARLPCGLVCVLAAAPLARAHGCAPWAQRHA